MIMLIDGLAGKKALHLLSSNSGPAVFFALQEAWSGTLVRHAMRCVCTVLYLGEFKRSLCITAGDLHSEINIRLWRSSFIVACIVPQLQDKIYSRAYVAPRTSTEHGQISTMDIVGLTRHAGNNAVLGDSHSRPSRLHTYHGSSVNDRVSTKCSSCWMMILSFEE